MRRRLGAVLAVVVALGVLPQSAISARSKPVVVPPPVIAIIEGNGVNALHTDFSLRTSEKLVLPSTMPRPSWVSLPDHGTFEERLEEARSGPLGNLEGGRIHWIRDTRLGVFVPSGSAVTDVFERRFHGTGTASAAVGLEHGTNPDALVIVIPDNDAAAWEWLAKQHWIDIISTSYFGVRFGSDPHGSCPSARFIRQIAEQGRLVFSSSGNVEQAGTAHAPSGAPFTYQVGGVDDEGRSYIPGRADNSPSVTPTRPYETGDRFEFPSADSESLDGSMAFGGTSGATPSTAGRAADLLHFAREILSSNWTGTRDGALAVAAKAARLPSKGPLSDGRLERDELTQLLHHIAVPAEPAFPGRYLIEGYGALNQDAVSLGKKILAGTAPEPERPEEDAMHEHVEAARELLFPAARCG